MSEELARFRGLFGCQPRWERAKVISAILWERKKSDLYPVMKTYAEAHMRDWGAFLVPKEPLENPPDFRDVQRLRLLPNERVRCSLAWTDKKGLVPSVQAPRFCRGTYYYVPNVGFVEDTGPETQDIVYAAVDGNSSLDNNVRRVFQRIITIVVVWTGKGPTVQYWQMGPLRFREFHTAWGDFQYGSSDFMLRCTDVRYQRLDTQIIDGEHNDLLTPFLELDGETQHKLLKTVAWYAENARKFDRLYASAHPSW